MLKNCIFHDFSSSYIGVKEGEKRSFFYYPKKVGFLTENKIKNRLTSGGKGTLITHSCGLVFFVSFFVSFLSAKKLGETSRR